MEEDHDYGEKEFLGLNGNFDGEDIIYIILSKPATAYFIARHLYSFFVEDEPQYLHGLLYLRTIQGPLNS